MDESAFVHYGQIYLHSNDDFGADLGEHFGGQRNGLCGGAIPGALFLITGLHTGDVWFTVGLHDATPDVDDSWDEIVEVSFRPETDEVALVGWAGEHTWPLDLPVADYRVRYSGTYTGEDGERYLLQFWPAPPAPDAVVKVTSGKAAYWHDFARKQPPPPTPEEQAEMARQLELKRAQAAEETRLRLELQKWGGKPPSERLRGLSGAATSVAKLDRPFLDAVAEAEPEVQREIARWVTRRAYVEAQLDRVPWIAEALDAMDTDPWGHDLPWDRLFNDPAAPQTLVTSPDGRHDNCSQQAMAFPAMLSATIEDPLEAACEALWNGAVCFGYGRHGVLFEEVRQAFPNALPPAHP